MPQSKTKRKPSESGDSPEPEPTRILLIRWAAGHTLERQILRAPLSSETELSDTRLHSAAWMRLQGVVRSAQSQSPNTGFLYSTLETATSQKRRMGEGCQQQGGGTGGRGGSVAIKEHWQGGPCVPELFCVHRGQYIGCLEKGFESVPGWEATGRVPWSLLYDLLQACAKGSPKKNLI